MEGEAAKDETLPPGFRFHPSDEELITHYLISKISDANFAARAVADVDLNKCEPWDLPAKAKMGEKEWYFFSLRDRKYPTGVRTNRATNTGYWKTTGKDKDIFNSSTSELVGMKKTLVFYRGRAPRGEKSNWVMHEYRIHSKSALRNAKDEWVVCRVFQKSSGIKKYPSNPPARSSNPYSLDVSPNHLIPHQMLQQADGLPYPMGRNYPELAELARAFRSNSPNSSMMNVPLQSASQMNYLANGGFTISGLNLNIGGRSAAMGSFPQHGMNQQEHVMMNGSSSSMMNSGSNMIGAEAVYGVEMSNPNGGTNRYVNNMDQCLDLENYWPPTY